LTARTDSVLLLPMTPNPDRLSDQYDRVKTLDLKTDITGWHYEEPIFERLVTTLRPRTYIEVGVLKGASLLRVAKMMRDLHGSSVRCRSAASRR